MRWPRKGILIRLCIYVPLIGYLGWSAWSKHTQEPAPVPEVAPGQFPPSVKVIELSREEAERRFGKLPDAASDSPSSP